MKILLSGGHLTPALAFIDYAQTQPKVSCVFVGREFAQTKNQQPSMEKVEVAQRNVRFIPFDSGKLSRPQVWDLLGQFVRFGAGFFHAFQIVRKEKPDVFLSFGGYLAVPLALACFFQRIPIVTHEQTRVAGVANKVIAFLANKVAISYPESASYFPRQKVVVTGNPLRPSLHVFTQKPKWLTASKQLPLLYVTGGSQGSQMINGLIAQLLPDLVKDWIVIHQCGPSTKTTATQQTFLKLQSQLPEAHQSHYYVREWISEKELAWIYQNCTLIVSRAGANTVQEIVQAGKPAIFIPLALAHADEQRQNAEAVASTGAAVVLLQKDATPHILAETIRLCHKQYQHMLTKARDNQQLLVKDGDQRLFAVVAAVVKS